MGLCFLLESSPPWNFVCLAKVYRLLLLLQLPQAFRSLTFAPSSLLSSTSQPAPPSAPCTPPTSFQRRRSNSAPPCACCTLQLFCNIVPMYNFAELMLPDGAHKRDEDTTIFMLRRSPLVKNASGTNHLREVASSLLHSPQARRTALLYPPPPPIASHTHFCSLLLL